MSRKDDYKTKTSDLPQSQAVTKHDYFMAASEYYRIQAELIDLKESQNNQDDYEEKANELDVKLICHRSTMEEYSLLECHQCDELLHYPWLSRDDALFERDARKSLKAIKEEELEDVTFFLFASFFAPMFASMIEPGCYSLSEVLLYSLCMIPGVMAMFYFLNKAVTYPITRRAESLTTEPIPTKRRFFRRIKFYKAIAYVVSLIIGFLFYLIVSPKP